MLEKVIVEVVQYGSLFSFLIATIALVWKVFSDLIKKNEAAKNRLLDKQHDKNVQLQKEKAELQRELESEKKRYVEAMINDVKGEIKNLYHKFNEVNERYIRLEEKNERIEEMFNQKLETIEQELRKVKAIKLKGNG